MRLRVLSSLLALAALVAAGVTFSGAAFTAAGTNPGNSFTSSNAFNLSATMNDPGANLRLTVSLTASAADGEDGSSITSVTIEKSPAGAGTWTTACSDTTAPYACSFDTTTVSDGLYDFRAVAQNDAGGSATSTAVTNRRVDNTAPTAGMTDPGTPLRATIPLDASGGDAGGSGVASVKIQRSPAGAGTWTDVCTDASAPYSCSFDTTTVSDGLYDFRAVATDNAGNPANSSVVANRRIDNTAPSATMTNPGSLITGTKLFDGTASDSGSGVASLKFQVSPMGAGTWSDLCTDTTSPYSCSYDTSGLADGQYDFRSRATDNAGNTGNSTVYSGAIVDNTAPSVTMTDPGQYLKGTINLDATAGDGAGSGVANVKIQRSPAGAGTWTDVCTDATSPYQCASVNTATWGGDGLYDLRAIATDNVSKTTTSTTVTNRRVDNTAPTAGLTDPGSPLRGTVTLNATGTDGGSGVANVKIQHSPTSLNTWTDICTDTSSPYSCSWNTIGVTDGGYDLRAVTTDNAGNVTSSSVVVNRVVDNAGPSAVDIQTTNGGATAGRPEANDTVTFTYSEQLLPSSVLFGWNGNATPVTVRMNNSGNNDQLEIWNSLNTARLPLTNTFVTLNGNFIQNAATFNATMVQNGASITITLGLQTGGTVRTENSNVTLSWPSSTTPTDLAGNACTGNTVTEGGAADRDF